MGYGGKLDRSALGFQPRETENEHIYRKMASNYKYQWKKQSRKQERVRAVITRVSKEMAFEQRPSKMRGQDL